MKNTFKEANGYIAHLRTMSNQDHDALLRRDHKITTDQQNLIELLSAAKIVVNQLNAVSIPDEMKAARDRLATSIQPCTIIPETERKKDDT